MLPSIDRLSPPTSGPSRAICRMLVLAPTRELAGQIAESARGLRPLHPPQGGHRVRRHLGRQEPPGRSTAASTSCVATPGRLVDLVDQRAIDLREVEILVLDEADQMLDLGFIHALKQIVRMLPKPSARRCSSRRRCPSAIQRAADQYLTDPAQVSVAPAATTAERVEQYVCFVGQTEKQALLTLMLREGFCSRGEMDRVLMFTRTKHGADRVVKKLAQAAASRQRDPRQQEPAAARDARSTSSRRAASRSSSRPTSPRAGSTSRASAT